MDNKKEKELVMMELEWKKIFGIPITFEKMASFNGITIEIRTNESNHFGSPHCHAKYQNQEISISLRDFSVLASNGMDKNHQRLAVEYVKNHVDFLIDRWNKNPNVIKL